ALTGWFAFIVAAYFVWATATANYPSAFQEPLASLFDVDADRIVVTAFEICAYLTLFLFPFLFLERWRETRWVRFGEVAVLAAIGITIGRLVQLKYPSFHHHAQFPFAANIVSDTA